MQDHTICWHDVGAVEDEQWIRVSNTIECPALAQALAAQPGVALAEQLQGQCKKRVE
jgi:hypothetical protein